MSLLLTGMAAAVDLPARIRISADTLIYQADPQVAEGWGSVVLQTQTLRLAARHVRVNLATGAVTADGDVTLTRNGQSFRAERISYDLTSGEGTAEDLAGAVPPFYLTSERATLRPERLDLFGSTFTTCVDDPPAYRVEAGHLGLKMGERVVLTNATLYIGDRSFLWLPRIEQDLGERGGLTFPQLGCSEFSGWYLRSSFHAHLLQDTTSTVHLEYQQKHGWSGGLSLAWPLRGEEPATGGRGYLQLYYAPERDPVRRRGLARLRARQPLGPGSSLVGTLDYLSDAGVREDYLPTLSSARQMALPSRVTLAWRDDDQAVSLRAEPRLTGYTWTRPRREPELRFRRILSPWSTGPWLLAWDSRVGRRVDETEASVGGNVDVTLSHPLQLAGGVNCLPSVGLTAGARQAAASQTSCAQAFAEVALQTRLQGEGAGFRHRLIPTVTYYRATTWESAVSRDADDPVHPEQRLRVRVDSELWYQAERLAETEVTWERDCTGAVSPAVYLEGWSRIYLAADEQSFLRVEGRYEPSRHLFSRTGLDLVLQGARSRGALGFREYYDEDARRLRFTFDTAMGAIWELAASLEWDLDTGTVREESYTVRRRLPCHWQLEVTVEVQPRHDTSLGLYLIAAPSW